MTLVMCFGSFDILHEGHLDLFRQADALGDRLVVVVARDATIMAVKGRAPVHDEKARLTAVRAARHVDEAVLGNDGDKHDVIRSVRPDVVALGYDQTRFIKGLESLALTTDHPFRIVRLLPFHPHIYKSSRLRKD
ncbi:MAG: adenylyltransferase/cytidyltransferase family protein [Nanoarchaeota archaeon]